MLKKFFVLVRQMLALMVGIPDYETYVAHSRVRHPGRAVMSYPTFIAERQNRRFGAGSGPKCC